MTQSSGQISTYILFMQLPTPEQALSKLMDTSNGQPFFSGPKTPGKLADMPFNLVSGVLVYKDKDAPQYMDLPAGNASVFHFISSKQPQMETLPMQKASQKALTAMTTPCDKRMQLACLLCNNCRYYVVRM